VCQLTLTAPFPWFGGKSRAADLVWRHLGAVGGYVEPFAGSLGVLLGRPTEHAGTETVNDIDGYVVNFWRAVRHDPEAVAAYCDWPVTELDLTARHSWLVNNGAERLGALQSDADWFDARIAGWWVWGCCAWIGSGWCSGQGPWTPDALRHRQLPHLGNAGVGVHRQLPHLGDAGRGVHRQLPHLGNAGRGVHRKLPHLGDAGVGEWLYTLSERLRHVRIACGDWTRVLTPSASRAGGPPIGVLLDPPYDVTDAHHEVYGRDYRGVSAAVRDWAIENGANPALRIALCGYSDEHALPDGWTCREWKGRAGYGPQENTARERIWFSPACLGDAAPSLFDEPEAA
jgi:hypothetical protein